MSVNLIYRDQMYRRGAEALRAIDYERLPAEQLAAFVAFVENMNAVSGSVCPSVELGRPELRLVPMAGDRR